MPLTGALQADFSDFVAEANKASAALGVMDAEAKKAGTTLAKTGQAVDGFGQTSRQSAGGFDKMTAGLRSVDASLNALGMNISKPIAAIEELSTVATKGIGALGALGTAGAVVAGAMAAWDFGKWSMQFNPEITAKWDYLYEIMGLNAIQAETLANKTETLARASAIAETEIVDLQAAIKIIYDDMKKHTAVVDTAAERQAKWEGELRKFGGALPRMLAALENHTATVKDLSREYGISTDALTFYIASKKDETTALAASTRETEAAASAQEKLRASMFGTDSITKANEYVAALGGISNLTRMTQEEQTKLNTVLGEAIEAYKRAGEVAPQAMRDLYIETIKLPPVVAGLGTEWANVGTKVETSIDHIITKLTEAQKAAAAYEAETQNQVQAYIEMQYGAEGATRKVDETTAATQRLTVAMADFGRTNRTAWESMQAGEELMQAYRDAGIFVGQQVATGGYQQQQRQRAGRELPTDITGGAAWGNTLNVNVNSTEAQDIAGKLVSEMSRQGMRF